MQYEHKLALENTKLAVQASPNGLRFSLRFCVMYGVFSHENLLKRTQWKGLFFFSSDKVQAVSMFEHLLCFLQTLRDGLFCPIERTRRLRSAGVWFRSLPERARRLRSAGVWFVLWLSEPGACVLRVSGFVHCLSEPGACVLRPSGLFHD